MLGGGFSVELLDIRDGFVVFRVSGNGANRTFANEPGGHRHQRSAPTDKRGRIHTSTITVAVLPEINNLKIKIDDRDFEWTACRGSGAGGQAVQKTSNAIQVKHLPTGLTVRVESRSQHQNREDAFQIIKAKLYVVEKEKLSDARDTDRKGQVGTGQRGDKVRTIRQQDGIVSDHRLNKKISYKDYAKGIWDGLIGP